MGSSHFISVFYRLLMKYSNEMAPMVTFLDKNFVFAAIFCEIGLVRANFLRMLGAGELNLTSIDDGSYLENFAFFDKCNSKNGKNPT